MFVVSKNNLQLFILTNLKKKVRDECLQDSFHGHTNEPFDTQICSELTGQLYGQRLNLQKHILDVG